MPVRLAVTAGTVADCSQALPLIEGIKAEHLLADKAYDTNEIVAGASARGMNPVIPPKSNRKEKRDYDRALYKMRHLVEPGFGLEFKQWRGVAGVCQELPFLPGHLPDSGHGDLEKTGFVGSRNNGAPAYKRTGRFVEDVLWILRRPRSGAGCPAEYGTSTQLLAGGRTGFDISGDPDLEYL